MSSTRPCVYDRQEIVEYHQINQSAFDVVSHVRRRMIQEIAAVALLQDSIVKIAWSYEAIRTRQQSRQIENPDERAKDEHLLIRTIAVVKVTGKEKNDERSFSA